MLFKCRFYFWSVLSLIGTVLTAQDLHYSQFFLHGQGQNPIYAGNYQGTHRVTANYRSQWNTVPVPYLSLSLYYDSHLSLKSKKHFLGVGIGLDYDKAGDSRLSLTALQTSITYGYALSKKHLIRCGLSPSIGQRRFAEEKLKWDNQWTGDRFDKQLSPRESYSLSGSFFFDLAGGVSYQFSHSNRTYISLGAAMYHLLKPDQSFYGTQQTKVGLPMRPVLHGEISIGLWKVADIVVSGQHQQQEKYEETSAAGMLRLYLDRNPGIRLNALLGCGIRLDDALYPMAGLQYKNWLVLASYDINTSPFKTATNQRGGLEIGVQYVFKSVEPVGLYKKCPIY